MLPEMKWFNECAANRTLAALAKRNIAGIYVEDAKAAWQVLAERLPHDVPIGMGGSRTIEELGILDGLRNGGYQLLDQYSQGITRERSLELRREGVNASWFLSGVNAISETGELVFIDGFCNRVAGVIYGAGKVMLFAGVNKICPDLSTALDRAQNVAAPANARRLSVPVPCTEDGLCHDCLVERRICNATVIIHRQNDPERMFLVLVGEGLGL